MFAKPKKELEANKMINKIFESTLSKYKQEIDTLHLPPKEQEKLIQDLRWESQLAGINIFKNTLRTYGQASCITEIGVEKQETVPKLVEAPTQKSP